MRSLVPIVCGTLLSIPSAALGQGPSEVEAAIHAGSQAWAEAWNAADAEALAALYTEDAAVMAPGSEQAKGRQAIHELFKQALGAMAGTQQEIKTKEVLEAGDWIVEIGTFVTTTADGSHADHGWYTALWKNVNGKWMMYRDTWNSSM
jgi:uncharacterized protein (TIGR02246 family)